MSQQPRPPQQRGRPGAMTMAMQAVQSKPTGPKVLRIGLIQDGKIVEERIIRKRETVSVGSSEKNHFVVTAKGLRSRFDLFQLVGNDYILNFTEDMRGRVGLAGGVQELDKLRAGGGARKVEKTGNQAEYYQVKLTDNSRGKVVIGNTTLLFQFVVPPPVQPRPQLPAAVVGGFVAGIDWMFSAFVMFSFMTHFGFIIYLENADWPVEARIGTIPDRVADLIFNEPEEPEPQEEVEYTDEGDVEEEGDEPTEVAEAPSRGGESSNNAPSSAEARAQANSDARLAAEEANARVEAMLLGALGSDGALADVLAGGAVTGDAADVMAQADGVNVATSAEGGDLRERGGGDRVGRTTGGLGGLAAREGRAGQTQQEGVQVVERVIRGRVNTGGLDDESGAGVFDSSIVTSMIRRRISAIQRCYERELRNNPTLAGRVMVRFTIQPTGSVAGASATENTTGSPAVATCVVSTIARFRFSPGPEGGSVSYSYPFVFAPQN